MSSRFDGLFRLFRQTFFEHLPDDIDPKKVIFSYTNVQGHSLFEAHTFSNTKHAPCVVKVNPGADVVQGKIWFTVDHHINARVECSALVEYLDEYRDPYYIDPAVVFTETIVGTPRISGF